MAVKSFLTLTPSLMFECNAGDYPSGAPLTAPFLTSTTIVWLGCKNACHGERSSFVN